MQGQEGDTLGFEATQIQNEYANGGTPESKREILVDTKPKATAAAASISGVRDADLRANPMALLEDEAQSMYVSYSKV